MNETFPWSFAKQADMGPFVFVVNVVMCFPSPIESGVSLKLSLSIFHFICLLFSNKWNEMLKSSPLLVFLVIWLSQALPCDIVISPNYYLGLKCWGISINEGLNVQFADNTPVCSHWVKNQTDLWNTPMNSDTKHLDSRCRPHHVFLHVLHHMLGIKSRALTLHTHTHTQAALMNCSLSKIICAGIEVRSVWGSDAAVCPLWANIHGHMRSILWRTEPAFDPVWRRPYFSHRVENTRGYH